MTVRIAQRAPVTASGSGWAWLRSAAQMAALYSGSLPDPSPDGADWTGSPRVATRTPRPGASSVAAARTFTLRTLARWDAAECADDAATVVSELLTNALKHAVPEEFRAEAVSTRRVRIGLLNPGPCILCAVADPSPRPPVHRETEWLAESGRGLQVVASLSTQWGFCIAPDLAGKVVWATFATARV